MRHYLLYHPEIPSFLEGFLKSSALQRLKDVGMNCGCEYSSFPRFRDLEPYSRYDHSLGVALIVWHFTQDRAQTVAGLLHDISTPVFAHVVDFLNGDYLTQESTEAGTEETIRSSPEICAALAELGLTVEEVSDYHRYPIADNDAPRLSADRLEYTLGNMLNYKIAKEETVRQYYEGLSAGINDDGEAELLFESMGLSFLFAGDSLKCSKIYVSDEDRYSMQLLSEILKSALERKILLPEDLYGTETEVLEKLGADPVCSGLLRRWKSYTGIRVSEEPDGEGEWRKIAAKKRLIDPFVLGRGRTSSLFPVFRAEKDAFLNSAQDHWICGI